MDTPRYLIVLNHFLELSTVFPDNISILFCDVAIIIECLRVKLLRLKEIWIQSLDLNTHIYENKIKNICTIKSTIQ